MQSNPIQSNSIQSNPIHANPSHAKQEQEVNGHVIVLTGFRLWRRTLRAPLYHTLKGSFLLKNGTKTVLLIYIQYNSVQKRVLSC